MQHFSQCNATFFPMQCNIFPNAMQHFSQCNAAARKCNKFHVEMQLCENATFFPMQCSCAKMQQIPRYRAAFKGQALQLR